MPKTHVLKCWPQYWNAIAANEKTFELRYADRSYAVGDILELHCEKIPSQDEIETGTASAPLLRRVTYVMSGGIAFAGRVLLDPSAVALGIAPVTTAHKSPDVLMIEHLTETLDTVRDVLAVEFKAGEPVSERMLHHLINVIDEALDRDEPETAA